MDISLESPRPGISNIDTLRNNNKCPKFSRFINLLSNPEFPLYILMLGMNLWLFLNRDSPEITLANISQNFGLLKDVHTQISPLTQSPVTFR